MSGFTPGPWEFAKNFTWLFRDNLKHDGNFSSSTVLKIDDGAFAPTEADARLIAAAPDGYAANEEALDTLEKLRADLAEECAERHAQRIAVIDLTIEQLRAALAKARGESA